MDDERYSAPMRKSCTADVERFYLQFPFEPLLVETIKTSIFPGKRRWDPSEKVWSVEIDWEMVPIIEKLVRRWGFDVDDASQAVFDTPPRPGEACAVTVDPEENEFVLSAPYYKPIRDAVRRYPSRFDKETRTWRFPMQSDVAKGLSEFIRRNKITAISDEAVSAFLVFGVSSRC